MPFEICASIFKRFYHRNKYISFKYGVIHYSDTIYAKRHPIVV